MDPINNRNIESSTQRFLFKALVNSLPYNSFIRSITFSISKFILPHKVDLVRCSNLPKRLANKGVIVNETKRLIKVEKTTTNENSFNKAPISPPDKAKGKNTTTSTSVIASAVKPISFLPSKAALRLSDPISR